MLGIDGNTLLGVGGVITAIATPTTVVLLARIAAKTAIATEAKRQADADAAMAAGAEAERRRKADAEVAAQGIKDAADAAAKAAEAAIEAAARTTVLHEDVQASAAVLLTTAKKVDDVDHAVNHADPREKTLQENVVDLHDAMTTAADGAREAVAEPKDPSNGHAVDLTPAPETKREASLRELVEAIADQGADTAEAVAALVKALKTKA